jgi:uncharacterized protein (DUF2147 family)
LLPGNRRADERGMNGRFAVNSISVCYIAVTHPERRPLVTFSARKFAASFAALALLTLPAFAGSSVSPAGSISPTGTWQSTTGESRYQVSLCGDGTELCAKLTWLRADARTKENLPYLNTYVVKGARATQANKWRGTVNYNGDTVSGSVTLVDADTLKLKGCKGFFCKSLQFVRV